MNNNINSGDNGDFYFGFSNNIVFNCIFIFNSNIYSGGSLNVNIFDISESGNLFSFFYDFCNMDCDINFIQISGNFSNFGGGIYDQSFIIIYVFEFGSGFLDVLVVGVIVNIVIIGSLQMVIIIGFFVDGMFVSVLVSFLVEVSCEVIVVDLYIVFKDCLNDDICDVLDIMVNIDGEVVFCSNQGVSI